MKVTFGAARGTATANEGNKAVSSKKPKRIFKGQCGTARIIAT
jgi:hypothetical protein